MASNHPKALESKRRRDRWHSSSGDPELRQVKNVGVPEDVERIEVHEPCFRCAARGRCRHRPWVNDN